MEIPIITVLAIALIIALIELKSRKESLQNLRNQCSKSDSTLEDATRNRIINEINSMTACELYDAMNKYYNICPGLSLIAKKKLDFVDKVALEIIQSDHDDQIHKYQKSPDA